MFDILVYLFETYYTPEAYPQPDVLAHKLAAVGFEDEEINDALSWLHGLKESCAQHQPMHPLHHDSSLRVYTDQEYRLLGRHAVGFIQFLEQSGALPPNQREIIIERALAVDESPLSVGKMKIIALMVLWNHDTEIDQLVFEELINDDYERLCH